MHGLRFDTTIITAYACLCVNFGDEILLRGKESKTRQIRRIPRQSKFHVFQGIGVG